MLSVAARPTTLLPTPQRGRLREYRDRVLQRHSVTGIKPLATPLVLMKSPIMTQQPLTSTIIQSAFATPMTPQRQNSCVVGTSASTPCHMDCNDDESNSRHTMNNTSSNTIAPTNSSETVSVAHNNLSLLPGHRFLADDSDLQSMENSLLALLTDFRSGKLRAC